MRAFMTESGLTLVINSEGEDRYMALRHPEDTSLFDWPNIDRRAFYQVFPRQGEGYIALECVQTGETHNLHEKEDGLYLTAERLNPVDLSDEEPQVERLPYRHVVLGVRDRGFALAIVRVDYNLTDRHYEVFQGYTSDRKFTLRGKTPVLTERQASYMVPLGDDTWVYCHEGWLFFRGSEEALKADFRSCKRMGSPQYATYRWEFTGDDTLDLRVLRI